MIGTTNRVLAAIEKRRTLLAAGIKLDGSPITSDLDKVERGLDLKPSEHFQFQELQVWAHVTGLLTVDEAMTVYVALGEVPDVDGWAAGTDLAAKLVITSIMGEILDRKIRSR